MFIVSNISMQMENLLANIDIEGDLYFAMSCSFLNVSFTPTRFDKGMNRNYVYPFYEKCVTNSDFDKLYTGFIHSSCRYIELINKKKTFLEIYIPRHQHIVFYNGYISGFFELFF